MPIRNTKNTNRILLFWGLLALIFGTRVDAFVFPKSNITYPETETDSMRIHNKDMAIIFTERLISAYKYIIDRNINKSFIDSFYLYQNKGIDAYIVISDTDEVFINLTPCDSNKVNIVFTELPAQFEILARKNRYEKGFSLNVPYSQALDYYNNAIGAYGLDVDGIFIIEDFHVSSAYPKIVDFGKKMVTILWGGTFNFKYKEDNIDKVNSVDLTGINILFHDNNFRWIMNRECTEFCVSGRFMCFRSFPRRRCRSD